MFLKKKNIFEVENVFISLEISWIGGIYILYLNKQAISPVKNVHKLLNKLSLTFLFPLFVLVLRTIIPKCTYTVFKNECSQFKNNVLEYLSLCTEQYYKEDIYKS